MKKSRISRVLSNRNWQCVISEVDNKPTKNYNLT
jgi:hypothetical protein